MAVWRVPVEIQTPWLPSNCVNVWHCRTDTDGDMNGTLDGNPIDALHAFYTTLSSWMPTSATVVFPTEAVEVSEQRAIQIDPKTNVVGTVSGVSPGGLAIVISWRTEVRARRGMGRTFCGPLGHTVSDSGTGTPTDTCLNAVRVAAQDLLDASTAANGWAVGVYGQQDKGIVDPKVLRDFTGFKVQDKFAHLSGRRD